MGLGTLLLEFFIPISELFLPIIPGDVFPYFFGKELGGQPVILFQTSLFAAFLITATACFFGPYLIIRNLSLIGDGLAHVSFGGIAIAIVMGYSTLALEFALFFSISSAILIYELQSREILTGDTAIAIFLTGMLALGLVVLQVLGGGITSDIHGYLFGNVLLISNNHLDKITLICVISFILLMIIRRGLLAMTLDPLAARVQGIPCSCNWSLIQYHYCCYCSRYGENGWSCARHSIISDTCCNCQINWRKFPFIFNLVSNFWIYFCASGVVFLFRDGYRNWYNDCFSCSNCICNSTYFSKFIQKFSRSNDNY